MPCLHHAYTNACQSRLKISLNCHSLSDLIKRKDGPITIAEATQIVDGMEPTGIIEYIFDAGERVQDLWDASSDGAVKFIACCEALFRQAVLHLLRSEEGETTVDRVLSWRHRVKHEIVTWVTLILTYG